MSGSPPQRNFLPANHPVVVSIQRYGGPWYRDIEQLDSGAFGTVFSATLQRGDEPPRLVVVKRFHQIVQENAKVLINEIALLRQLTFPRPFHQRLVSIL